MGRKAAKVHIAKAVLNKECSFVCELVDGNFIKDTEAVIKEITKDSFLVSTKYNIDEKSAEHIDVCFFDGKMIPITLSSKTFTKTIDTDSNRVLYDCHMETENPYAKKYLIIHSPKRGEKRKSCQVE